MKKLYFKRWIQDALTVYELVLIMALGDIADNVDVPIESIIITGLLIIINAILLLKYGKFEEE